MGDLQAICIRGPWSILLPFHPQIFLLRHAKKFQNSLHWTQAQRGNRVYICSTEEGAILELSFPDMVQVGGEFMRA